MNVSPAMISPKHRMTLMLRNVVLGMAAAGFVLFSGAMMFLVGSRYAYENMALPGVGTAGMNLAGWNAEQIEAGLWFTYDYPQAGRIVFRDGDRYWEARPTDLGLAVDVPFMTQQLLAVGRSGTASQMIRAQIEAWFRGIQIPPRLIFDERIADFQLHALADLIDQPMQEASLTLNGVEVEFHNGQIGRELDIEATLDALVPFLSNLQDASIDLVIHETHPIVLDASTQADAASQILNQSLILTAEDAGPWTIEPAELASMLRFTVATDGATSFFQIELDSELLTTFLALLAPDLARQPQNARVIFNDDTRQLDLMTPAVIGRILDIDSTIEAIQQGLLDGEHQIPLVFEYTDPAVTDDTTAADLGITEAVSVVSTFFYGSSSARVHNIKTASSAFHGMLIPPGGTVSMAEILGDISLDTGYREALIIYNGRTVQGAGGGVCQVSTTLFRTAFFGGYQIDKRYPHAYRVRYYETGTGSPGPGLDATVFVPRVDFQFTNDTEYWLLMETYVYNNNQLQWKFYSTSDGRQVDWSSSGPQNVIQPDPPLYRENPDLEPGVIEQVEWEAEGMDIVVYRTVTRNGEVLHDDTFRTRYLPWQAVYEYGPETELPPEAGEPDNGE
ncbi:MAG: VanW family protein [Anaerolineales bacterium]|jgi:vancomycin resistance protein YoaR